MMNDFQDIEEAEIVSEKYLPPPQKKLPGKKKKKKPVVLLLALAIIIIGLFFVASKGEKGPTKTNPKAKVEAQKRQ